MPSLPDAAIAHDRQIRRVSLASVTAARRIWGRLGYGNFDAAWRTLGPQLFAIVAAAQTAAVRSAGEYVPTVLDELGIDAAAVAAVAPRSLVGVASDGRPLPELLFKTVVSARTALGSGSSLADSLALGQSLLDRIVTTQVADADRTATSVGMAVRPAVTGYVRMLQLPSCSRCVVLAGRVYRWSTGFQRHPMCDCRMIPSTENVAGDMTTDPLAAIKAGQVRGLSQADTKAIVEDGADMGRVINAHRGMATEQAAGRTVKTTKVLAKDFGPVRLRPETIYQMTGNRDDALKLLKKFGYII